MDQGPLFLFGRLWFGQRILIYSPPLESLQRIFAIERLDKELADSSCDFFPPAYLLRGSVRQREGTEQWPAIQCRM